VVQLSQKNNLYIQIRVFFIIFSSRPDICQDEIPDPISAAPASGGTGAYTYLWEQSNNNLNWINAIGGNTNPSYVPGIFNRHYVLSENRI